MTTIDLKQLIEANGYTITELAEATGLDYHTVYRWTRRNRVPSRTSRQQIADVLGIPVTEIPNGDDPTPSGVRERFARLEEVPATTWTRLFELGRGQPIDIVAGTGLVVVEQVEHFAARLAVTAVDDGTPVRVMLGNPDVAHAIVRGDEEEGMGAEAFVGRLRRGIDRWATLLADVPGAELRLHSSPYYWSFYRFGSHAIVVNHMYGLVGSDSPATHTDHADPHWQPYLDAYDRQWASSEAHPINHP